MRKNALKILVPAILVCYLGALCLVGESVGYWLMVTLLSICAVYLGCKIGRQTVNIGKSRFRSKVSSLKYIATWMGFFLMSGTIIYLFAFKAAGEIMVNENGQLSLKYQFSNIEVFFRSLICSLDLFALNIDNNLLDTIGNNKLIKGIVSVQAVLSFSCTVAMIAAFASSRLWAYYVLRYKTRVSRERNHLYIFFGNGRTTELLIKDIVNNDPKAITAIVDRANVSDEETDEWESIVGMITHRQYIFRQAKTTHTRVAIANQHLQEIDSDVVNSPDFDAFEALGINRIKKLITKLADFPDSQLHIFFINEGEDSNIRNILTLSKDCTIQNIARQQNVEHCIYCHARLNGPNRVVMDLAVKKGLYIKIVDSSRLAIDLLKLNPDEHPVNLMELSEDNPATVESKLTALIVGFGEVGRDAFRFLYEFGAFVDSKQEEMRSAFECVIVDKEMDNIEGIFKSTMPGIFSDDCATAKNVDIRFIRADYNDTVFNQDVLTPSFLERVNYVVIAVENGEEGSFLASRIFSRIRQVREDLWNARILVRCADESKLELLEKTALHYNQGYGAGEENVPVIRIFGQPGKIYTYDLIVSNRFVSEGKIYHEKYRKLSKESETWEDRRNKLISIKNRPDIDNLRKLRRQESQTIANALHAATKMYLFMNAMETLYFENADGPDWQDFMSRYFDDDEEVKIEGERDDINYPELTAAENKIIRNLAILEHMRWNAAHELMGYVFNDKKAECDERTMKHNCLCAWSKLDEQSQKASSSDWFCDYKKYDFSVIDTSIALHLQK